MIYLYFSNQNLSFGNKVYDESLRFKTQLLNCFCELYLTADFVHNYSIKFGNGFDFDRQTRNAIRVFNRKEICEKYELDDGKINPEDPKEHKFSLKRLIYFLLDNYYPRVGWRWIGATHFVYFFTLKLIQILFELGFWKVSDFDMLLLKLYEISEVLVSLEKNSAKDSDHLAQNFNKELRTGFSSAREYLSNIIIYSYQ